MKPKYLHTIKNQLTPLSKIKIAMCYLVSFFKFIDLLCLDNFVKQKRFKFYNLKFKITSLTFIIFNLSFNISQAQTYPVQINTQLVPPYSGYLPDYADPTAQNLKVFLQFNDFSISQYNLRLKFEIKGNGFSLVTKSTFNPPPISLQPGQPMLLSGLDLAPYLSSNNLDFIGINQNQYEQRMALPEGYYSICITAFDYYSGNPTKVSNEACAQGWFTLSNPPLLNLPFCNSIVNPLEPQNIVFNWTPVNLGSPNSSFNTSYLFELWEMRPDSTINPNQIVLSTQPIYSSTTEINSLNYGITETPLNLYTKYVWRVKAIDGSGKDWFINKGYSQVCTFHYGSLSNTIGNAANLNLLAEATDYVSGSATWTLQNFYSAYQLDVRESGATEWSTYTTTTNNIPLSNLTPGKTYECRLKGISNTLNNDFGNIVSFTTPTPPTINLQAEALDYVSGKATWATHPLYPNVQVEIRKKNTPNWFPYTTSQNNQTFENLEPNKTYECRIKGFGLNFNSEFGNIAEFTTPAPPNINCNQAAPSYSNNSNPLPYNKAISGMTVKSGQFDVRIKFISPGTLGSGYYTGSGYAMMFGILPIPVTFTNVFIDDKQRQQQGLIHAVTKGMKNWMEQFDIEDAEENATYVEGTLDSVYVNGNQYCYVVVSGFEPPTTVCLPLDTTKLPLVIRDGDGNQYVINGSPPTVKGPTSYLNISNDNLAATDNLKVQFTASANQNFGFDSKEYPAFTEEYECIKLSNGKNYFVANKSIGNGVNQNDKVIATFTINNFNAAQLSFKTKGGGTLTKTSINNNTAFEVNNIPANAECVYAWYNNQKIGKLNIISLNKVSKKVVLVPVNGASTAGITQQGLNDIYKQANTTFTLTTAPNFTFDLGNDGLEVADAKLFSKYSAEMRALRDAYKQKDSLYDKSAYYIFVVPNFSDVNIKGYMVRGRALGFVTSAATTTDLAHELGHGAFKLEHTFDAITKGTSNNLMDYNNQTHLTKGQWFNIQNPSNELTWWDEEEDGSKLEVTIDDLKPFANADGTFSFLSPTGKPITFNGSELSNIYFYFNDGTLDPTKQTFYADGTLQGFKLNTNQTWATCFSSNNNNIFGGYFNQGLNSQSGANNLHTCGGSAYAEELSKLRGNNAGREDSVIIATTCLQDGKLKFSVKKVPYTSTWPNGSNNAGITTPIIPNLTVNQSSNRVINLDDKSFKSKYSKDAITFINAAGTCNYEYIPLVITVANIISKYPSIISQCRSIESIISTYDPTTFLQSVSNNNTSNTQPLDLYKNKVSQLLSDALILQQNATESINGDANTQNLTTAAAISAYVNVTANQCALTYLSAAERLRLVKILAQSGLNNTEEKAVVVLFNTINANNATQAMQFFDGLQLSANNVNNASLCKALYDGMHDVYNNNFTDWIKAITRKITNNEALTTYFTINYNTADGAFEHMVVYSDDGWSSKDDVGKNTYDVTIENDGNVKITRHVIERLDEVTTPYTDEFGFTEQITTYTPVWKTYPQVTFGPFDLITTINNSELVSLKEVTNGEQFNVLPAIFFKFAQDKQFNDNALKATVLTLDAITITTGPGALMKAYRAGRAATALLEGALVVGSAGNIATNSLPNGSLAKEYVTKYNMVIGALLGGKLLITGGFKLRSLATSVWNGSVTWPGLKLADIDYLINNFNAVKNELKTKYSIAQYKAIERLKNYLAKIRKIGGGNVNGVGNSLFGRNIINGINGFSDNVASILSQRNLSLNNFKLLQQKRYDLMSIAEKADINAVRNSIPIPDGNTLLQKVIPKSEMVKYTSGQYSQIGGFVSTAKDAKHLNTFDDIYYGMRLDYTSNGVQPFKLSDGSCGVIRYKTPSPNLTTPKIPEVPGDLPYTGNGFTGGNNGRLGVPEWKSPYNTPNDGAELWEVFSNGDEVLKAKFSTSQNKFILVP